LDCFSLPFLLFQSHCFSPTTHSLWAAWHSSYDLHPPTEGGLLVLYQGQAELSVCTDTAHLNSTTPRPGITVYNLVVPSLEVLCELVCLHFWPCVRDLGIFDICCSQVVLPPWCRNEVFSR
jgi:hypothetical protein